MVRGHVPMRQFEPDTSGKWLVSGIKDSLRAMVR